MRQHRRWRTSGIVLAVIASVALCDVTLAQVRPPVPILEDLQRDQWKGQPTARALGELPPGTDDLTLSKDDGWLYDGRTYHDFHLEYEVRLADRSRHRLFFRTLAWPRMSYELRFDGAGGRWRGGVHVKRANMPEKRIKIEDELLERTLTHSGWDRIEVRCVAGVATVIVNRVVLLTLERLDALGGKVGFAGEGATYRHARLTALPMDTPPAFLTAHQPGEEGLELPTVIKYVAPEMPAKVMALYTGASISRYRHVVWIEVVIDADGRVVAARYLRRLDDKDIGFNENAMRAVRGWTFNPARLNGAPVPICVTIEVFFELG